LKQTIENVYQSHNVKGVKILLSGRLDGAEMSRAEYLTKGKIPLATLRADIDFSKKTAYTKYGTTGLKVWIYKGDVVADEN
jgi:small subunit ribosomal protein S3